VTLSEEESEALNHEVSEEEIKGALWSMKPFKALGPNGLHVGFLAHGGEISGRGNKRHILEEENTRVP